MNQIAHNGRLLSLDDIVANTGIEFSLATYLRLQEAFHASRPLITPSRDSDGSGVALENFFRRFKKGSKPIRKIMSTVKLKGIKVIELNNVRTFLRLSSIAEIGEEIIKKMLKPMEL